MEGRKTNKKLPQTGGKKRKLKENEVKREKKEDKIYVAARMCETHILNKIAAINEAEKKRN